MTVGISKTVEANVITRPERYYYLDWLRVGAILSVFLYHCNRFFDYRDYSIQSVVRNLGSTIHREFFQIWMMPLFFIISGAAVFYSLKNRRSGGFIKERFLRILLPLGTIGIFIIAPPQIYLERLMKGQFTGSFFQWYPHYFDGFYPMGNFAPMGMHLWYLAELFLFSMILLPLFIPIGKTDRSIVSRISILFEKPWALFLLFLPIAGMSIVAEILGIGYFRIMGGWDPLSYFTFFVYGYLLFSNTRIHDLIRKYSTVCLVSSLVLTVLYLYLEFGTGLPEISAVNVHNSIMRSDSVEQVFSSRLSIPWAGILILRSLLAWCWIISLLGLSARVLNFKSKFLEYANEAVLPFYILHQTILLIIGFFVIQLSMGVGPMYLIIVSISFLIIMAIYEFLIRRLNLVRFFFGMKLEPSSKICSYSTGRQYMISRDDVKFAK